MQKTLFALLMLTSLSLQSLSFAASNSEMKIAEQEQALAKGKQDFIVLKEHGKLFFTFTPTQPADLDQAVVGTWQAFVVTPDDKTFEGPIIDVTAPPATFVITVDHPILFGDYTVVIKDISATGYPTDFISQLITVTNSFNNLAVDTAVTSFGVVEGKESTSTFDPAQFTQGTFRPYHPFIPK